MGIVEDIESRLSTARQQRLVAQNSGWREYVTYTAPEMDSGFDWNYGGRPAHMASEVMNARKERTRERSIRIYNSKPVIFSDRLVTGMEALVSPQSMQWNSYGFRDPLAGEPTHEEREYLDRVRDYVFRIRYSGASGFALANKTGMRSAVKLGTGVYYIEENEDLTDTANPIHYQYWPLYQVMLEVDARGNYVGFFREFPLTASQAVKKYDDKVSDKVRTAAKDPKRQNETFWFVHACFERDNGSKDATTIDKSRFESVHYETASKHINKTSGYFEYPLAVQNWMRDGNSPYGKPQAATMMGDIKSLNTMTKDRLVTSGQALRPPMALAAFEGRLDMNPAARNPGLIDEQGRKMFAPITEGLNPGAADNAIQTMEEGVRLGFFGDLWQVLLEGSGRTATEVMVRQQEKGEMMGPYAANLQEAYETASDRELGILARRGAFGPGSALQMPETMQGKDVVLTHTAPIDALRKRNDMLAIQAVREHMMIIAQTQPDVLDKADPDAEYDEILLLSSAPATIGRTPEEVAAIREARQEQQAMMANAQMANSAADTLNKATPALALAAENGVAVG